MITFRRLKLQNIIYYKQAELDLDYTGITVIKGRNHNVVRGMLRSNGSGKSLLVSTLASLFGYGSPTANTSKRSANRDLMDVGSSISVEMSVDDVDYVLAKTQPAKALKYEIIKGGIDQKPRTPSIAAEEIHNIVGLSEDEFFSLVYLNSIRPYLLQTGSASQRLSFFSNLFRLDDYDVVRSHINAALSELKDTKVRHDTLRGELEIAEEGLRKIDSDTLQQAMETMEENLSELNGKLHAHQDKLALWRIYTTHSPLKAEILTLASELNVDASDVVEELSAAKKAHKNRVKYDQYLTNRARIRASILSTQEEIKELRETLGYTGEKTDKDTLRHYIKSVHSSQQEYDNLLDRYTALKERIVACPETDQLQVIRAKLTRVEKARANARASLSSLVEQKEHIEKHLTLGKGVCTVCGSELSLEQAQVKLEYIEDRIEKQQIKVSSLVKQLDTLYEEAQQAKIGIRNEQTRQKMREIKSFARQLQKDFADVPVDALELLLDKVSELDSLKKLAPTWDLDVPPLSAAEYQARCERLTLLQSLYGNYNHVKDKLIEAEKLFKRKIDYDKNLGESIETVRNQISEIQSNLPSVKAQLMHCKTLQEKVRDLSETVTGLNKSLKDAQILSMLQEAYSSKGLKALVAQRIAAMIQRNMNNYSGLLFPEPFQFKFVVDANQFDILVRRKAGTSYRISDVRFLSGAESRAFTLLCLISIMPLIPKARRTNICILDELEANLDASGRDLFINQFLPAFNLIVPHVIVVTPGDDVYPDSRVFVATKRGNETRLLKAD